jgi:hypothetical protein
MGDDGQVLQGWAFGDAEGCEVLDESQDTVGARIAGRGTYAVDRQLWRRRAQAATGLRRT